MPAGDTLHILRAGDDAANPAVVAPSIVQGLHSQGVMDVVVNDVQEQTGVDAKGQEVRCWWHGWSRCCKLGCSGHPGVNFS